MAKATGKWRATYTPGSWVVLSGPTCLVILQPAPPKAAGKLNQIWESVVGAESPDDLIEQLSQYRLNMMPDFAAFFWAGQEMRSLVRGRLKIRNLDTTEVIADGAGFLTWHEIGLGDVRRVRVEMEEIDVAQVLQLPLVVGGVAASVLDLDATDAAVISSPQDSSAGSLTAAATGDEELGETEPMAMDFDETEYEDSAAPDAPAPSWGQNPFSFPTGEPAEAPDARADSHGGSRESLEDYPTPPPYPGPPPAPTVTPAPTAATAASAPSAPAAAAAGPGGPAPIGQGAFGQNPFGAPAGPGGPQGHQPPHRPESPRPQGPSEQYGHQGPQGQPEQYGFSASAGAPQRGYGDQPGPGGGPGYGAGFSPAYTPQRQADAPPPQHQQWAAPTPQGPGAPGPGAGQPMLEEGMVMAVECSQGHPNPPENARCRRCGNPTGGQPHPVPRPVLAVLRPSSGGQVEVDRPVLIGRSPTANRVGREQLPTLLTVPSPSNDISRSHLQVAPEGWELTVTDLHSTNGTALLWPGRQEAERLTPGEAVRVQPGCILDLGDGIRIKIDQP